MRQILKALLLGHCIAAHAAEGTISNQFIQLLKKNAAEKQMGTNDPKQFFARVAELAKNGDPSAQFLLGLSLMKERRDLAEGYLAASAKSGCAGAEMGLGVLAMQRKQTAVGVAHFKLAAEKGEAMAQVAISGLHQRGDDGFERSLPKAFAWLRLAERQTFSTGAMVAINEGMKKLESSMTEEDKVRSEREYAEISAAIPKVNYYFCGQSNIETGRDPNIAYYYKF